MSLFRIHVNKNVIKWAIIHGELTEDEAISKFPVNRWINPIKKYYNPTFKQLQNFSHQTHIPFSYFFSNKTPHESYPFIKFRTINNKFNTPSRKLIDVMDGMKSRQAWMKDYLLGQNHDYRFKYLGFIKYGNDIQEVSKKIFNLLYINTLRNQSHSDNDFYNNLKIKISSLGVIVMQSGIVGNNTHRKLSVDEFRAFALIDSVAPLIFINSRDSKRARVFSLIHELIHILLGSNEILNATPKESHNIEHERWINSVTANVLLPSKLIFKLINKNLPCKDNIRKVANKLHVSVLMATIRLKNLDIDNVNNDVINWAKKLQDINLQSKSKSTGGNYYNTASSRVDKRFASAVINYEAMGIMPISKAASMIGVSRKSYNTAVKNILGLE